jgi:hypothetical protein
LFVYLFFVEDQSAQRAMLVYPRGGWRNTAWCLALTSWVGQMSPRQVWSPQQWHWWRWWQPHLFSQCRWCGEAFYRLGVQGIEVLIPLGALFPPNVAPASQQDFGVTELTLSCSAP